MKTFTTHWWIKTYCNSISIPVIHLAWSTPHNFGNNFFCRLVWREMGIYCRLLRKVAQWSHLLVPDCSNPPTMVELYFLNYALIILQLAFKLLLTFINILNLRLKQSIVDANYETNLKYLVQIVKALSWISFCYLPKSTTFHTNLLCNKT